MYSTPRLKPLDRDYSGSLVGPTRFRSRRTLPLLFLLALASLARAQDAPEPPTGYSEIAEIVERGIESGEMPGAVVVVADSERILYQRAFGDRQIEPTREPMTLTTLFDMASLTKPVATATSVMILVQRGKIELDQTVTHYVPEFQGRGKEKITVRDLLLHVGGLIPDNALRDYDQGVDEAWRRICDLKPIAERGEKYAYTDVGFMVLGKLVERIDGRPLDRFAAEEIFEPLEMNQTTFNPPDEARRNAAPTERRDGEWIKGVVHDPRAFRLDGVAGHAGLFSTAADLVRYGQMMLRSGRPVLEGDTVDQMTTPHTVPRGTRALGWDHRSPYSSNRGEAFSDRAFGHGGFTGTVMWIDPGKDRIYVFLSNRLHPDGKGTVNRLAGRIATLIGTASP